MKKINSILLSGLALSSAMGGAFAIANSEGLTKSSISTAIENDELVATSSMKIMPYPMCDFDYKDLSDEDREIAIEIEKEIKELNKKAQEINEENRDKYEDIYDKYFSDRSEYDYDEYREEIEDLEKEIGLKKVYDEIEMNHEKLQDIFDGCYNQYDEKWTLMKLSDEDREKYLEIQEKLNDLYDESNDLYEEHSKDFDKLYEEHRKKIEELRERIGLTKNDEEQQRLHEELREIKGDDYFYPIMYAKSEPAILETSVDNNIVNRPYLEVEPINANVVENEAVDKKTEDKSFFSGIKNFFTNIFKS